MNVPTGGAFTIASASLFYYGTIFRDFRRHDSSSKIHRADKGNATAILDTTDLIEKIIRHLRIGLYKDETKSNHINWSSEQ